MFLWWQVISLAGELLSLAESLLQDGLHVSEVADGYKKAAKKVCLLFTLEILDLCLCSGIGNARYACDTWIRCM